MDHFLDVLTSEQNNTEAAHLLDYRQYFDYDLLVWDSRDAESKPVSVDKQSGKMSGGENQSPYFVAILASYLRAYKRHERRWNDPSLALVPIDEAFSKMDTGRIKDCIEAIQAGCLDGEDRATAIRQLNELNGSILSLEGPRRDSDIIHQVRFQPPTRRSSSRYWESHPLRANARLWPGNSPMPHGPRCLKGGASPGRGFAASCRNRHCTAVLSFLFLGMIL